MNRSICCCLAVFFVFALMGQSPSFAQDDTGKTNLFDGTFAGWEGDTEKTWRVESGAIVAGSLETPVPRNDFLATTKRFSDFELTLKFKTTGAVKINAGIQFRSERVPDHHEVCGYQADIGQSYYGCLYDESRRNKILARPDDETAKKATDAIPEDGWYSYRIRAEGNRVQLWLNGVQTVDYTETDESLPKDGIIALQVHGGMVGTIAYKDIEIKELAAPKTVGPFKIEDMDWISGHWTGEAMGGQFEETWNGPLGGEMMGMFKLIKGGKVVFYELMTIEPKDDSYVLRIKHFGEGLVGWEEKDKSTEFPLESVSENEVRFNGLKFHRESGEQTNQMVIDVVVDEGGKQQKLKFECSRANQ